MILSRFFKPKWQHRNPDIRKNAIEDLDDLTVLNKIVQQDEAAIVRRVAVRKIEDLDLLHRVAQQDTDERVRELSEQRLKQLLCGQKESGFDLDFRLIWLNKINSDSTLLEHVAVHGQEFELRLRAVENIEREGLLGDIAIHDPASQVRLAAIEKITQKSTLERVFKTSRNRDKRVSRIAKDKLDILIEQVERPKRVRIECESICTQLETLVESCRYKSLTHFHWEQKNAEFRHLQERWQHVVGEAETEFKTRMTKAQQAFQLAFENYQQAREALRLREQALRDAKQRICLQAEEIVAELHAFERIDNEKGDYYQGQLETLKGQWAKIQTSHDTVEEQRWQTRFETGYQTILKQCHALQIHHQVACDLEAICTQVETWLLELNPIKSEHIKELRHRWQQITQPQPPSSLIQGLNARFDKSMTALQAQLQTQKEQREQLTQTAKQLLADIEVALENGELRVAGPLRQQAHDVIKDIIGLPPARYKALESRLQAATIKINELRDWQRWGNQRERENLCQQAEALLNDDVDKEESIHKVKILREAWRRLGASGQSQALWTRFDNTCQAIYERYREMLCQRIEVLIAPEETAINDPYETARLIQKTQVLWKELGGLGRVEALWERFKTACDKAYEPCKRHFDTQAQEREKNLLEKQAICERLEAFAEKIDWEQPHWKEIYHFYHDIEKAWRRVGPTDRKANKAIQARFRAVMQNRLDEEQQRNCRYRLALLGQVEEIARTTEDIEQAIAAVKKVQAQWQVTVPASRKVEREFWKVFRSTCDIVFDRRRQQQEAAKKERQVELDKKIALCEQAEALAASNDEGRTALEQVKKLRLAWDDVGVIPKKMAEAAEKRFIAACKQIEKNYQLLLASEQRQQLDILKQKATLCRHLEKASLEVEQVAAAKTDWETLPKLVDETLETMIAQRFEQACTGQVHFSEAAKKTQEMLCIQMEILAGIDSPPEATEDRMAYQVARLSEAMTSGDKKSFKDKIVEAQTVEQQWYLADPVEEAVATRLQQRFDRACQVCYTQQ